MTPPSPPVTEFCHLFHMRMTPPPPPAMKFCHLFHMQGRNNSFLKYTEEHKCPTRQNHYSNFKIIQNYLFVFTMTVGGDNFMVGGHTFPLSPPGSPPMPL